MADNDNTATNTSTNENTSLSLDEAAEKLLAGTQEESTEEGILEDGEDGESTEDVLDEEDQEEEVDEDEEEGEDEYEEEDLEPEEDETGKLIQYAEDGTPLYETDLKDENGNKEFASLQEMKNVYVGQKTVDRGINELSQVRKIAEQHAQKLASERRLVGALLDELTRDGIDPPPPKPNLEHYRQYGDKMVEYYKAAEAEYEKKRIDHRRKIANIYAATQPGAEADPQAIEAYIGNEMAILAREMPELGNVENIHEGVSKIKAGITRFYPIQEEEVAPMFSHTHLMVMADALRYRLAVEAANSNSKGKKPVRRRARGTNVAKGRAMQTDKARVNVRNKKEMAKLKQSGRVEDAAALIKSRMGIK